MILKKYNLFFLPFALFFIIIFLGQDSIAQNTIEFEVGLKDLPSEKIGNMIRDQEGFLWFAYYGGVGKYDTHEVKYYTPGENSISGPGATSIVMDEDGILWILTKDNGLNKYDKETDTFTYFKHDPNNKNSINSNISESFGPQRLYVGQENRILIGTMGGFDIYDKKNNVFKHYVNDPDNPNSLSSNNVTSVIQGKDGIIWIGTFADGLNRFDESTGTWTRYQHKSGSDKGPASDMIWSLLEDSDGTIWVGTSSKGLSRFDKNTQTFSHYRHDPDNPNSLGDDKIYYLYEDSAANIWVTHKFSDKVGLEIFNKEKNEFTRFSADPKNPSSISSNGITTVYEDPVTGIFWIINQHKDVFDKYDKESHQFRLHQHDPANPDSIASQIVLVMHEDNMERLMISVMGSLEIYDQNTGTFSHFPYEKMSSEMGNVTVAMYQDDGSIMWLLDNKGVLTQLDTNSMKPVKHYIHEPNDPDTIMASTSTGGNIIKDRDNPDILWLALSSGIEKFNKKTEEFTHFTYDADDLKTISQGNVWSVYDDGKGFIWVSAFGGLSRLDKQTQRFTRFVHNPDNPESIGFTKQSIVFEDSFGNFWICGLTNGIDLLDRKTGVFKHFNKKNGFPANGVNLTIQEDAAGHLWIGTTDNGLIKFDIKTQKVMSVYSKSDGLQGKNFWRSYKNKEGQMWFGGGFGVNSFYPDQVKKNPNIPPIVLTSFTQGGEKINLGIAPERLKEVTLGWKDNFFEFKFAALNYTKPEKNRYAYMLMGRDKNWYYCQGNPSGRYTGLEGGTYTLRLKGSNNDGLWNEKGTSIKITIIPPFWKTIWFYSVLVCLVILTIGFVILYLSKLRFEIRERNLAEDSLRREKEFTETALNAQLDTFFLFEPITGKAIRWNKAFNDITGYTDDEISGMKAPDSYYSPEDLKKTNVSIQDVFKTGTAMVELELICKDGRKIPSEYSVSVIYNHEGQTKYFISIGRDTTNRKKVEKEKEKLESQLRLAQKSEAIGTLAGGIAHDFNNILSGILGYSQLAEMHLDNPIKVKGDLGQIVKGAQRAAGLIQQILTFSRPTEYEKHQLKLYIVINEALKLLRSSIPSTIEIKGNIASKASILADATQMHQVIMNLCTNAYHSMRNSVGVLRVDLNEIDISKTDCFPGYHISIGKYLKLEVCDTGQGMDQETLNKAFDPYFTTKKIGEGSGLGLALVFGIVKDHEGYIIADSDPGKGSTFKILLPITEKPKTNENEQIKANVLVGGTEKIMIVDDEKSILSVTTALLEGFGYRVSAYLEPIQAFHEFERDPDYFDLIITDMTMPKMTGDELSSFFLKIRGNMPIILCTGYNENISKQKALKIGIKEYVQKPVDNQKLILLVRQLLDNNDAQ